MAFTYNRGVVDITSMKGIFMGSRFCLLFLLAMLMALLMAALSADAQRAAKNAASAKAVRVDLSQEKSGREPAKFLAVVGNWSIVDDGGRKVLAVDGRKWLRGQPAGSLAEKARAIYGARNEEFIDNVKAWAYFPYAVANEIPDFQNGDIRMRFKI